MTIQPIFGSYAAIDAPPIDSCYYYVNATRSRGHVALTCSCVEKLWRRGLAGHHAGADAAAAVSADGSTDDRRRWKPLPVSGPCAKWLL